MPYSIPLCMHCAHAHQHIVYIYGFVPRCAYCIIAYEQNERKYQIDGHRQTSSVSDGGWEITNIFLLKSGLFVVRLTNTQSILISSNFCTDCRSSYMDYWGDSKWKTFSIYDRFVLLSFQFDKMNLTLRTITKWTFLTDYIEPHNRQSNSSKNMEKFFSFFQSFMQIYLFVYTIQM